MLTGSVIKAIKSSAGNSTSRVLVTLASNVITRFIFQSSHRQAILRGIAILHIANSLGLLNLGGDAFIAFGTCLGQSTVCSPDFAFPLWTDGTQVL